ncbi:MAG: TetR/AcrR family transcriptional regulator [Actinomycetota bacterium]|jgi:AcrR family transcriptional regulator|nr:TetR/AcrR family transcriptional regulator [Actinomycetota bacterium]
MAPRLPAAERRDQLLIAALTVFSRDGYHGTSMNDVAVAAGVTKPVLYQHFPSKQSLYLELLSDVGAQLDAAIVEGVRREEKPNDRMKGGLTAYFTFVRDHRAEFELIFGSGAENDPKFNGAVRGIEWSIADHIAVMLRDLAPPDVAQRLAHGVVGMAEGACRHWLRREPDLEPETLGADLADMVWNGLGQLSLRPA